MPRRLLLVEVDPSDALGVKAPGDVIEHDHLVPPGRLVVHAVWEEAAEPAGPLSAEDCILLAVAALGGRASAEHVERLLRAAQREGFPVPIRFRGAGP